MKSDIENLDTEISTREQMLAIVSHDIKNPLAAIQLEAQMLLRSAERDGRSLLAEEVKIQARRILKTTERLRALVADLLERNQNGNALTKLKKEIHEAKKLIHEALELIRPLATEKKINLIVNLLSEPHLSIDRNKIIQVISNLLNNAIKFTPLDGNIEISLSESEFEYVFKIEDSGPGIEDIYIKRAFDKYWSINSPGGTGLGLFICKTIIEAHAGTISVSKGKKHLGACFQFTIPKTIGQGSVTEFSFLGNIEDKKKIYIIDDDDDLREVVSWALGKEGYAVYSFDSPAEALSCLKSSKSPPDLVLVDYHMHEMKGAEFIKKKKEIFSNERCPVLMISADPYEIQKNIPRKDYQEILEKPLDLEGLVNGIKKSFLS